MNRFNFLYAICFLLSGLLCGGCSKVGIDTFDETQATVTVPWNSVDVRTYPGYNSLTKTFDQTYSFWSDPEEETMVVNIPLKLVGDVRDYDRTVGYTIVRDSSRLLEGSYKVLNAVIPAGERYGYLTLELPKLVELEDTTCMMEIVLGASEYFVAGPPECTRIKFSWDNQLPMLPSGSFYARTYNFLINAGQSMNLANYNYYSRNAHKAILAALGWPWQADQWPQYNRMDPDGYMFYNTAITNAYYELLQKYLDDYEQEHGTPLLHDGGLAINQPVRARKF